MRNTKQRPAAGKAARSSGKSSGRSPRPGKGAANTKWWEQAEEVPRSGLPDAEKLTKKAKRMRRFVFASVFLCPFLMLTTIVAVANGLGEQQTASAGSVDPYGRTKADAVVAIRKWLAQKPSPLPGGVLVGWDSATSEKSPKDPDHPEDQYDVEIHRLTIASPGGTLFDTTVTLGVSDLVGTVVIGEPSLIPRPPSDTSFNESVWPDYQTIPAPEPVKNAVSSWAEAYSSGDPNALRIALQDTDVSRSYMPLIGARIANATIDSAIPLWDKDATAEDREAGNVPDRIVVQAVFEITWNGQTLTDEERGNSPALVTYDLLVEKANTGAPVVVAWGGAGTGPSLKPYGNAVKGRTIEAPADNTGAADDEEGGLADEPLPSEEVEQ